MATSLDTAAAGRPPIHILEEDYDVIAGLALLIERTRPELSRQILEEIDRAEIHPEGDLPPGVVRLGSEVEFLDEGNGERRRVRLVLPDEADIGEGRVSILTPVGAGLIGLSTGQTIDWPLRDGRSRALKILSVE